MQSSLNIIQHIIDTGQGISLPQLFMARVGCQGPARGHEMSRVRNPQMFHLPASEPGPLSLVFHLLSTVTT